MDDTRDDAALVEAARSGDRRALDLLLRRHADRIGALCLRLTGDRTDAADAAQEALLAIVKGLPRFDQRSRFSTWAYRVATNACLDELRRRRRRPEPTELPDVAVRDDRADQAGTRLDVDAALARLPLDYRTAVVLRDLCDLEYAEIAEVTGVPLGTVRSRIARGRAALADLLGNQVGAGERPTTRP